MTDRALEALIEEITVDAYGDEGFDAFACYFVDEIGLRRHGLVVGEEVDFVDVFFDGDERRGLSARCRRDGRSYAVALLDVVFPHGSGESLALAAYRQWLGLDPWPSGKSNGMSYEVPFPPFTLGALIWTISVDCWAP